MAPAFNPQQLSPLGRAAIKRAEQGKPVFPLVPGGNKPLIRKEDGGNGYLDATCDLRQVTEWWRRWPDANLGMPTGHYQDPITGLVMVLPVVTDGDPRNGYQRRALEAILGGPVPVTRTIATPRGGEHFLWHLPPHEDLRCSEGELAPGLDVRASGGYVAVPPSVRPEGVYRVTNLAPVAPMPLPMFDALRQARAKERAAPADDGPIPEGVRDSVLWREACYLRHRGHDEATILAALREMNQRCVDKAGRKAPLPDEALRDMARRAVKYAPDQVLGHLKDQPHDQQDDQQQAETEIWTPRSTMVSFDALMRKQMPSVQWVIPGLLSEGCNFLVGGSKKGKSWLVYGLAVAAASGGRWLGHFEVVQSDVLYLSLEDNERRLKTRGGLVAPGQEVPRLTLDTAWPRLGEGGAELLRRYLHTHPDTRLVIIDVLAKIRPRKKGGMRSPYDDDYADVEPLQELAREEHVCLVVVHHSTKGEHEDWMLDTNSTMGLIGAADNILLLRRKRGAAEAELHVDGRDIEEDPALQLHWDQALAQWSVAPGTAEQVQHAPKSTAALAFLEEHAGEQFSPKEVAEALGWKLDATKHLLLRLAEAGKCHHGAGCYWMSPMSPEGPGPGGERAQAGDMADVTGMSPDVTGTEQGELWEQPLPSDGEMGRPSPPRPAMEAQEEPLTIIDIEMVGMSPIIIDEEVVGDTVTSVTSGDIGPCHRSQPSAGAGSGPTVTSVTSTASFSAEDAARLADLRMPGRVGMDQVAWVRQRFSLSEEDAIQTVLLLQQVELDNPSPEAMAVVDQITRKEA